MFIASTCTGIVAFACCTPRTNPDAASCELRFVSKGTVMLTHGEPCACVAAATPARK